MSTPNWRALIGLPTLTEVKASILSKLTDPPGAITNLNATEPTLVLQGGLAALLNDLSSLITVVVPHVFRRYSSGAWLVLHAEEMGTAPLPEVAAQGFVTLTRTSGSGTLTVPVDQVITTTAGTPRVRLLAAVSFDGVGSVQGFAEASLAGAEGNAAPGTLTVLDPPIAGVEATNGVDWISREGRNPETETELKARLDARFDLLARVKTVDALTALAREVGARAVAVVTHPRGQGTADLVILGPDGFPSSGLVAALQARVEEIRGLDDDILVRAPTLTYMALDLTLVIHPVDGDVDEVRLLGLQRLAAVVNPAWTGDGKVGPFTLSEDVRGGRISASLMALDHVLEVVGLSGPVTVPEGNYPAWSSINLTVVRADEL
jgi:hypothetical protein